MLSRLRRWPPRVCVSLGLDSFGVTNEYFTHALPRHPNLVHLGRVGLKMSSGAKVFSCLRSTHLCHSLGVKMLFIATAISYRRSTSPRLGPSGEMSLNGASDFSPTRDTPVRRPWRTGMHSVSPWTLPSPPRAKVLVTAVRGTPAQQGQRQACLDSTPPDPSIGHAVSMTAMHFRRVRCCAWAS